jgi:hypothetical protein
MAFRHIVLLRFEGAEAGQVAAVVDALRALPPQIPELARYDVALDARLDSGAGNADLAVVAEFADAEGYAVYRDHPAHRKVIDELILPILTARMAHQHPF